jgi:5-methylcytosine-specific restriction endonuclease McrA
MKRVGLDVATPKDIYHLIPKSQVLIVDSSMTVQDILPWERAAAMIVTDVAWTLLEDPAGRVIHTPRDTMPWPVVACLYRMVPRDHHSKEYHPDDPVSKHTILERDGWTCQYCGQYGDTIDHIIPKSRGGPSTWGNMCCACHDCNASKDNMTPDEADMHWPEIPRIGSDWRRSRLQAALFAELTSMSAA